MFTFYFVTERHIGGHFVLFGNASHEAISSFQSRLFELRRQPSWVSTLVELIVQSLITTRYPGAAPFESHSKVWEGPQEMLTEEEFVVLLHCQWLSSNSLYCSEVELKILPITEWKIVACCGFCLPSGFTVSCFRVSAICYANSQSQFACDIVA